MVDTIRDTDIGTEFQVIMKEIKGDGTIAVFDISSYTTLEIEFLENNGSTVVVKVAAFKTNGIDGVLFWTTLDTSLFLNKPGNWFYRAHIAKTGADFRNQNWIPFEVLKSVD